jgi:hypothetical protein
MLWKKSQGHGFHYYYVAVKEAHGVDNANMQYGQREFRFILADGTTEHYTFERDEYDIWWSSFLKGGQVINHKECFDARRGDQRGSR